jgi:uncharacterized coiled-coil DUF342 family protein
MPNLRFSRLYLLSQKERAGLEVSFNLSPLLVRAPNNHGKSAILKSLYDSFGAQPHKIDDSWKSAEVTSLLDFSIDGKNDSILKTAGSYSIFDSNRELMLTTRKVSDVLAPFLAKLLSFRLVMADKADRVIIPPPAYIFAPFYVDQDQGWIKPWSSFSRMYLPKSAQVLSDYHSGVRPNEYYEARAERERLRAELTTVELERKAVDDAIKKIRDAAGAVTLNFELEDFSNETDRLVNESRNLHKTQVKYREELGALNEERQLWFEQKELLRAAIAELEGALSRAAELPSQVDCPICGQGYDNSLVEQFGLIEDVDGLIAAHLNANRKIAELDERIQARRSDLKEIEVALAQVHETFAIRKSELTFRDVIAAEGKVEATKLLHGRRTELDNEIAQLSGRIVEQERRIKGTQSKDRTDRIKSEFADLLSKFARDLDVRLDETQALNLSGVNIGRGSEGPRALLAYYFAFLRISASYATSANCPIVIDAPNQQGQDKTHMPAMMKLMLEEAPQNAQLIIGAEDQYGLSDDEINVLDVSGQKDRVLRFEQFDLVAQAIRPFTAALVEN